MRHTRSNPIVKKTASILALTAAMSILSTPIALAGELVQMDKTHMLKLQRPAASVFIGNPDIADITVVSDEMLFLIGKGFGETDLLILDAAGNTILSTDITVVAAKSRHQVSLINGSDRETYHCAPECRPSPKFGDSSEFVSSFAPDGSTVTNSFATTSALLESEMLASMGLSAGADQEQ